MTGILRETVTERDGSYSMTEETAQVADFLPETFTCGKRIRAGRVDQRVAATHADVLVNGVSIDETHVGVMPQKAGQRMSHVGSRAVLTEVFGAATASADAPARPREHLVVHHVPPQGTAELREPL